MTTSAASDPRLATLSQARWLARRVLGRDPAGIVEQVPAPLRLSERVRTSPAAREYALWWARHPDRGGTFDVRTRPLRVLPDRLVLRLLFVLRYDGLIYERDGKIVGHLFFQRHGSTLHAFSTAVDGTPEIAGASVVMMLDFVAYAAGRPEITRARVGRAANNTTRRLNERMRPHAGALGWRVDRDGWVDFQPASP